MDIKRWRFLDQVFNRKKDRISFHFPTTYEQAHNRAQERRTRLRFELDEVGDSGFIGREFLEIPPGFNTPEQRSLRDDLSEAHGQMARLNWQVNADELLLLERVVDTIVVLLRQEVSPSYSSEPELTLEYPLVKLEPLDVTSEEAELFPWRVVIETDIPDFYISKLSQIKEWLGIAVEFGPKPSIHLLNRCIEPGGLEGVIGGLVEDHELFAMTCSHVLSEHCGSVKIRGNPYKNPNQLKNAPDAALVDTMTPCFTIPRGTRRQVFSEATDQIVLNSVHSRTKVFKLGPGFKNDPGVIINQVGLLPPSNRGPAYRFPHLEIKTDRLEYLFGWLKLPLGHKYFSGDGDSGSWVINPDLGIWFGMVIAGDKAGVTYAAEASPLLEYFERELKSLRNSKANNKLLPYTLS